MDHRRNMASLSIFYWYYFGTCLCELGQLVALSYSQDMSTCYPDRLRDFSVTISICSKDVMSTVSLFAQVDPETLCL